MVKLFSTIISTAAIVGLNTSTAVKLYRDPVQMANLEDNLASLDFYGHQPRKVTKDSMTSLEKAIHLHDMDDSFEHPRNVSNPGRRSSRFYANAKFNDEPMNIDDIKLQLGAVPDIKDMSAEDINGRLGRAERRRSAKAEKRNSRKPTEKKSSKPTYKYVEKQKDILKRMKRQSFRKELEDVDAILKSTQVSEDMILFVLGSQIQVTSDLVWDENEEPVDIGNVSAEEKEKIIQQNKYFISADKRSAGQGVIEKYDIETGVATVFFPNLHFKIRNKSFKGQTLKVNIENFDIDTPKPLDNSKKARAFRKLANIGAWIKEKVAGLGNGAAEDEAKVHLTNGAKKGAKWTAGTAVKWLLVLATMA